MRFDTEVDRIRTEYEHRAREIPTDSYAWSKPWNLLFHQHVVRGCIRMLQRAELYPLAGRTIADVGCGDGTWLLEFVQWGAAPSPASSPAFLGAGGVLKRFPVSAHTLPGSDTQSVRL